MFLIFIFCFSVSFICLAIGTSSECAVRVNGPTEEEIVTSRTLYHQK